MAYMRLLAALFVLGVPALGAAAPTPDATRSALETFRDSEARLAALVETDATEDALVAVVDALIDYDALSSRVLDGKDCANRCAEFDVLLAKLIRRSYLERIPAKGKGSVVIVNQNSKTRDGRAHARVNTIVVFPGARQDEPRTIKVAYLMHESGGRWWVYDLRTEGVSLTRMLKRDLAALYRDGGIDRVLARMASKLADPG